jgi:hypothetical protein
VPFHPAILHNRPDPLDKLLKILGGGGIAAAGGDDPKCSGAAIPGLPADPDHFVSGYHIISWDLGRVTDGLAAKTAILQTGTALRVDNAAEMNSGAKPIQPETIRHLEQFMGIVIGALEQLGGLLERKYSSGKHPLADPPHPRGHSVGLYGFHLIRVWPLVEERI